MYYLSNLYLLFIYVSITFFVLVITEKKNSLARLVMWGRTLKVALTPTHRTLQVERVTSAIVGSAVGSSYSWRIVELSTKLLRAMRGKRL